MVERIILDVDPGIDDALAILLALRSPELKVEGLTTVSGNVDVEQCTKNALKIVEKSGEHVKVYRGYAFPFVKEYVDARDTHGEDGLGETFFGESSLQAEKEHAVDFILQSVEKYPGEIVIVALGPLTNIAAAIQKAPETMQKIKRIVLMGGTAKRHGNCSPVAEYNFWVDPDAANVVMHAGLDITMFGLDVTHRIIFTPGLREVVKQFNAELSSFVFDITQFYVDFHWEQEKTLGCVINDPLVIASLIDPSIVQAFPAHVAVETTGPAIGQSVVDFLQFNTHPSQTKVCMEVNPRQFFEIFLKRLFPNHVHEIDIVLEKEYRNEVKVYENESNY